MLSFIPVLIDLLINVHDVSLLQRKLPVDRGSQHLIRCPNVCKIKMLLVLAKGDFEWGQRGQVTEEAAPYVGATTPLFRKLQHIGHVSSLVG